MLNVKKRWETVAFFVPGKGIQLKRFSVWSENISYFC